MPDPDQDILDGITFVNKAHGVCGFVSVMTAMYERKKIKFPDDIEVDIIMQWDIKKYIYKHIGAYLDRLEKEEPTLLIKINEFTQTFGGLFSKFTCKSYKNKKVKEDISIAIPPDVVVDYLKRMFGISNAVKLDRTQKAKWHTGNAIIGFGDGVKEVDIKHYGMCQ